MDTKEAIVKYLKQNKTLSGKDLCDSLSISRQALNKHLKVLIENRDVIKEGNTRGAVYKIAGRSKTIWRTRKKFILQGLEEDQVFRDIALLANFKSGLRDNVLDIVRYAFTEILNNAIEHSFSEVSDIEVTMDQYRSAFRIRDYGIGIFSSIYKKF